MLISVVVYEDTSVYILPHIPTTPPLASFTTHKLPQSIYGSFTYLKATSPGARTPDYPLTQCPQVVECLCQCDMRMPLKIIPICFVFSCWISVFKVLPIFTFRWHLCTIETNFWEIFISSRIMYKLHISVLHFHTFTKTKEEPFQDNNSYTMKLGGQYKVISQTYKYLKIFLAIQVSSIAELV